MPMTQTADEQTLAAFSEFIRMCNTMAYDAGEAFAGHMQSEHRTLQQSSFRVMSACIEAWAKNYETGRYDARNEQTVRLAFRIWNEILRDEGIPLI